MNWPLMDADKVMKSRLCALARWGRQFCLPDGSSRGLFEARIRRIGENLLRSFTHQSISRQNYRFGNRQKLCLFLGRQR
jgi:hypothetical protein